jgi:hypothetical protein
MMSFVIQKIPIATLIGYFIGYIILHIMIGLYVKKLNKDTISPDMVQTVKFYNILFKIFPALYVIFLMIVLR